MHYYFAIMGIALLGMACWLFWRRLTVLVSGVTTTGRIESHQSSEIDESVSYFPMVSFTDSQGNRQQFRSVAGGSSKTPPIGTEIKVCYARENPKVAFISSFLHMWAAPIGVAVLGIGGLFAAYKAV